MKCFTAFGHSKQKTKTSTQRPVGALLIVTDDPSSAIGIDFQPGLVVYGRCSNLSPSLAFSRIVEALTPDRGESEDVVVPQLWRCVYGGLVFTLAILTTSTITLGQVVKSTCTYNAAGASLGSDGGVVNISATFVGGNDGRGPDNCRLFLPGPAYCAGDAYGCPHFGASIGNFNANYVGGGTYLVTYELGPFSYNGTCSPIHFVLNDYLGNPFYVDVANDSTRPSSVSPLSATFDSSGGSGSVNVVAPVCSWAAYSNVNWITVTSPGYSGGNGTVEYSVAPNPDSKARTGFINIANSTIEVRQYAASCAVSPLTPITDPIAQSFEAQAAANMSPVWTGPPFEASLLTALSSFQGAILGAGGNSTLTSGYRPPAYQTHLQEVWNKWQQLKSDNSPACASLKSQVQTEMRRHKIKRRPAGSNGPHTQGKAFDLSITGLTQAQIRAMAYSDGLCRFDPLADPVHFSLISETHGGECDTPPPPALPGVIGTLSPSTIPQLDGVTIGVLQENVSGQAVYHYSLVNNSNQVIVSISVGDNGTPTLSTRPHGWTGTYGLLTGTSTSAPGWVPNLISQEESTLNTMQWSSDAFTFASFPGQILTGFSVALDAPDSSYLTGPCIVTLDDGSIYSVPLQADPGPVPSPISQTFTASSSTGTLSILAADGNSWQAVSNSDWITITAGTSGTGNGAVTYSITSNTGSTNRVGTIDISGRTYTVYQGVQFNDVPTNYLFYNEISKLSAHGITLGCGGGNFCTDQPVTREQMAAFIIRALGDFNPPAPTQQQFSDVPPSNVFYAFIDQLAQLDITLGCGNGNYCPSDPVTREQMAAFLIRTLGDFNPPTPTSQRFSDVPPGNVFYAFIDELAARGITLGCGGGNYCPSSPVTRGQMAAFLARAFSL